MAKKGRPTDFSPEFVDQVYKLCLLRATDVEIAAFFEVSERTINTWKKRYPDFLQSIRAGKQTADAEVANSLFQRATGAQWTEEQAIKVKRTIFENGKKVEEREEVVTVPLKKAEPPDTHAISFWLRNRKAAEWKDKTTVSSDPDNPLTVRHQLDSTELIAKIVGAASKPKE